MFSGAAHSKAMQLLRDLAAIKVGRPGGGGWMGRVQPRWRWGWMWGGWMWTQDWIGI